MPDSDVAVVVGAGPGLGAALARRFARAGMRVAVARRDAAALTGLLGQLGAEAKGYACDATDERAVADLFASVRRELGTPRLVAFNAGGFVRKGLLDTSVDDFERCWRTGCLGGFLVGREAVRAMLSAPQNRHRGTVLFTGATASLRGGASFHNLAVPKFALRALSQSMAREFQPQGIHIAHVIIDGQIESDQARFLLSGAGSPTVVRDDSDEGSLYVLMPMRV